MLWMVWKKNRWSIYWNINWYSFLVTQYTWNVYIHHHLELWTFWWSRNEGNSHALNIYQLWPISGSHKASIKKKFFDSPYYRYIYLTCNALWIVVYKLAWTQLLQRFGWMGPCINAPKSEVSILIVSLITSNGRASLRNWPIS